MSTSRIVLLGATGYTGRLIAASLVRRGASPVLAGRSATALAALADELGGGCEVAQADVTDGRSVRALLEQDDVLISTVGPFLRLGDAAVEAAIDAGAHYVDTTGEGPFIHRVFTHYGARAAKRGSALLPAMGYDYVPGNLAGALTAERGGPDVQRLDIGYFFVGKSTTALSGGTTASVGGVLLSPSYVHQRGGTVEERCGARVRRYEVDGRRRPGLTLGSSEVLTLPRRYPWLQDVDVHQGGLGAATGLVAQFGRLGAIPGAPAAFEKLMAKAFKGSTGGPDAATRARSGTRVIAEGSDRNGEVVQRVVLAGPNVYDATADLTAWAASEVASGSVLEPGAQGAIEAFGVDAVVRGCAEAGIAERGADTALPAQSLVAGA